MIGVTLTATFKFVSSGVPDALANLETTQLKGSPHSMICANRTLLPVSMLANKDQIGPDRWYEICNYIIISSSA